MRGAKSWLEISERRLRHNYGALVRAATVNGQNVPVLAVVKARAYGHGADLCAPALASAGAPWLGVTDVDEGLLVRRSLGPSLVRPSNTPRLQPRILVMCGLLPEDVHKLVEHDLTPVVWSEDHLLWVSNSAQATAALPVHLEIDTGMSRQGVSPGLALEAFLDRLSTCPRVFLEGVLTHFASAEVSGSPVTALQQKRFETALHQIASRDLRPAWIHAGNSSFIDDGLLLPWLQRIASVMAARPMVRSGLALYGYCLPLEGAPGALGGELAPVLSWKSRVIAVEDLSPASTIGYNATYTVPQKLRLALLPVGYADGLRRELSGSDTRPGGWVVVHGQRAPILGRISMNLTTVDVTAIPKTLVGDEVTLLGESSTADDHARIAETIPYDVLCGLRAQAYLTP